MAWNAPGNVAKWVSGAAAQKRAKMRPGRNSQSCAGFGGVKRRKVSRRPPRGARFRRLRNEGTLDKEGKGEAKTRRGESGKRGKPSAQRARESGGPRGNAALRKRSRKQAFHGPGRDQAYQRRGGPLLFSRFTRRGGANEGRRGNGKRCVALHPFARAPVCAKRGARADPRHPAQVAAQGRHVNGAAARTFARGLIVVKFVARRVKIEAGPQRTGPWDRCEK
ncbi:hypothetical protein EDB84DRAFT_1625465 [Lactarius hengduanensis]|nr:hypothetical protein EDB84DRAFT_1625465 [Lactarius hengduanensis]